MTYEEALENLEEQGIECDKTILDFYEDEIIFFMPGKEGEITWRA